MSLETRLAALITAIGADIKAALVGVVAWSRITGAPVTTGAGGEARTSQIRNGPIYYGDPGAPYVQSGIGFNYYGASTSTGLPIGPVIGMYRAGGTDAVPTQALINMTLGGFLVGAYDGAAWRTTGRIVCRALENQTATAWGNEWQIVPGVVGEATQAATVRIGAGNSANGYKGYCRVNGRLSTDNLADNPAFDLQFTAGKGANLTLAAASSTALTVTQASATGYGAVFVPGADTGFAAVTINNAANTVNAIQMYGDGSAKFTGLVETSAGGFKFPDGSTQTTAAEGGWKFINDAYTALPGDKLAVLNDGDIIPQINITLPLNPPFGSVIEIADIGYMANTNPIVVNIPSGNTIILPNQIGSDPGPFFINAAGAAIRLVYGGGGGAWRLI